MRYGFIIAQTDPHLKEKSARHSIVDGGRRLAFYYCDMLYVYAIKLFFRMFIYVMFCTLKAGGDSKAVTFLDCGLVYIVGVPVVYASVYLLGIRSITLMVLMAQLEQLVRLILTAIRYRQFHWAKDLTTLF